MDGGYSFTSLFRNLSRFGFPLNKITVLFLKKKIFFFLENGKRNNEKKKKKILIEFCQLLVSKGLMKIHSF